MSKAVRLGWLDELTSGPFEVLGLNSVGGGCISDAYRITVRNPAGIDHQWFVKQNTSSFLENFQCESRGLSLLDEVGEVRTPKVISSGIDDERAYLAMQWIPASVSSTAFNQFGEQLAKHHRKSAGSRIGLDHDNFLGATLQKNEPTANWEDFVVLRRIEPQVSLACDKGLIDTATKRLLAEFMRKIPNLLQGRPPSTCLIHGDLWSGNYWFDQDHQPVWADPAVYYGCRESEFGMILLFGNCPPAFFDAYQATWPLPDGWRRRVQIYVAYHLLNHVNLFGASYLSSLHHTITGLLASR